MNHHPYPTATEPLRLLQVYLRLSPATDCTLQQLRGAIAAKAGLEHDEFHNHNNDDDAKSAYKYRYPLIQYKWSKQGDLHLVCVDKGIEALQHLFQQSDWNIQLQGKAATLQVSDLKLSEIAPQIIDSPRSYAISNWYALSQDTYKEYHRGTPEEQHALLTRLLTNQIVSFANAVGYPPAAPVVVEIESVRTNSSTHKGVQFRAFRVAFRCNILLPANIGIGKGAAFGCGVLHWEKARG